MAIPIASFGGGDSAVGGLINAKLLPEYEIVHASTGLASALAELPALASGDLSITPSSGFGTNADSGEKKVPTAIIIGGTVPPAEAEQLKAAVSAVAPAIKFVQVTKEDIIAAGGAGPDVDLIVKLFKEKLAA
ncbi:hypothetical protein B0T16DRAFT_410886 [Cercophora newfieldiana]|uniref:Uncharacterized protein n=1 Tax=Cercophora newfieldiana TaxID=92897 RepID=A0AA39YE94_9PEZI|nr:hypothetical protein B0T16DRAFT_410886 [Cercophora newfieldiana]